MNILEKMKEMLENKPELEEKLKAEIKSLAESREATDPDEALIKAIKNVLDIDLTREELAVMSAADEPKELDPDEMDTAAGGKVFKNWEHRFNNRKDAEEYLFAHYMGRIPTLLGLCRDDFIDFRNKLANDANSILEKIGID